MRLIRFTTTLLAACFIPLSTLAVQWGYTGETAPGHWGELNKEYEGCQAGTNQSPIDIQTTAVSKLDFPALLRVQYVDSPTNLLSTNSTIQANINNYASDTIEIGNQFYVLKNFVFHAPSEHSIDGKTYAMELQLTHKNQHGDIAIMAVLFDVDEPNQAIQSLWESFPTMEGNSMPLFSPVNINQLLPDIKTYWRYSGSLTTPPCTEAVTWVVLKTPMTLSAEQLEKFRYIIGHPNNRPQQPLNERKIMDSYSDDAEILY